MNDHRSIAYFSMEIALHPDVPTYSGGLGILAGDTLRAAADLQVPIVAVTLLHRKGYFYQRLDSSGWQTEEQVEWEPDDYLHDTGVRTELQLEGRTITLRAWQFDVRAAGTGTVPVILLDSDVPENSDWDRQLTHWLYGGDHHYRLCQEVLLGIGGVRMLRALGYAELERFHMNEGHAALLTLELLREERERVGRENITAEDLAAVRRMCVFTTHTPVPAGHDQFELEMVDRVLGGREACGLHDPICHEGRLNMTYLALTMSYYVNGVAKKHGEVSRHMFAEYKIDSITNGVHAGTWVSKPFARVFDAHIPGWRQDSFSLRYALSIPCSDIAKAHAECKEQLLDDVNQQTNAGFRPEAFTIGFARRVAAYKRADLVLTDLSRLRTLAQTLGPIQLIFGGKAHPQDFEGKKLIQHIFELAAQLSPDVRIAWLPNYDMDVAMTLISGSDLWLNTPQPPMEASGTSGMKAALNGVPSLSTRDGWWLEGCIEGVTGWDIGNGDDKSDRSGDAASLYDQLEHEILPVYFRDPDAFTEIRRHCIAINGAFFNTQRMLQQYVTKAYLKSASTED